MGTSYHIAQKVRQTNFIPLDFIENTFFSIKISNKNIHKNILKILDQLTMIGCFCGMTCNKVKN